MIHNAKELRGFIPNIGVIPLIGHFINLTALTMYLGGSVTYFKGYLLFF